MRIVTGISLSDIDDVVIGLTAGQDKAEKASEFLTTEIAKAGGVAVVEVDGDKLAASWDIPEVTGEETKQVAYVAHLLQAGLLIDPSPMIAGTAYNGGLGGLTVNLLAFNSSGLNKYMAERDANILVMAAPLSPQAWTILGLIRLDNRNPAGAADALMNALLIDKYNILSRKYLGVALTVANPAMAVQAFEECLVLLGERGIAPNIHMRASYGMALLAAGAKVEAGVQFMLVCGHKKPRMTPLQWVNGGYAVADEDIAESLAPQGKKPKA